jgi:myo-inositol-1(or 4)-monophosphatase
LHGIPIFAVSIALEREGQLVAGIVYNPASDDLYMAERGQGAWHNNRRLRVAPREAISDALIGCGVPHLGKASMHPRFKAELAAVMARAMNVRRLGSAALDLAFTAAGRLDAYWERDLNAWDIAAGIVLVREAGGFVSDLDGGDMMLETGNICVGNDAMRRQLLALVRSA